MIIRVLRKVSEVGWLSVLKLTGANIVSLLSNLNPGVRSRNKKEKKFDVETAIETAGNVAVDGLGASEDISRHLVHYEPSRVWLCEHVFSQFSIKYEDFVMVDIGSGKGRVLVLAARFPFRKIIGIEISLSLHRIAVNNINTYSSQLRKCDNIELIHGNAIDFSMPVENTVYYLYNPFDGILLRQFMEKLNEIHTKFKQRIVIIYVNPVHSAIIREFDFLHQMKEDKKYIIYTSNERVFPLKTKIIYD